MKTLISFFKVEQKNLFYATVGSIFYVFSIEYFLNPYNVYPTGLIGLATEITTFLGFFHISIDYSIFYFALNIPLIILSWSKIGKKFTLKTLYVVALVTLLSNIIDTEYKLIDNAILSVVFSAILSGVGVGLVIRGGGSSGGSDIVSVYYALIRGKSVGLVQIFFNSFIIVFAVLLTQDFEVAVYMIILIGVSSIVTDKTYNIHEKYMIFAISQHADDIKQKIYESQIRGITLLNSVGGYTNNPSKTLIITLDKVEIYQFVNIIKEADPHAFINVIPIHQVVGRYETSFKQII